MAVDRQEELLRRAVETSLIGNDDNQVEDILAVHEPYPTIASTSVNSDLETFSPGFSSVENANQDTSSSIDNAHPADEQFIITEDSPKSMVDTQTMIDSSSRQQSSATVTNTTAIKQTGPYRPEGPVGIDIGTTSIVIAEGREKTIHSIKQTKFSTSFPLDSYTKNVLFEHEVPYFELSNFEYLQGYATETIGNFFHGDPLWQYSKDAEQGRDGLCLIEGILQNLLGRPKMPAVPLYFSVPGASIEGGNNLLYHTGIIQSYLAGLGYSAKPVNEGLAVVMAELADNNFTGIGVSVGGGMCHICLAYLSVPVVSFSIPKAGDYIDRHVAASTGELLYKVKTAKENDFSMAAKPANHVDRALRIYYDDVVQAVVNGMKSRFRKVDLPIHGPVPIVFSGGLMKTKGLLEAFAKALNNTQLPVEFSRIQQASDPSTSVARGALVKAMFEEF